MKKNIWFFIFLSSFGSVSLAQSVVDSTGFDGDHLDLNGVLEVFKSSENVEAFEKNLNQKSNGVNNVDLNVDGEVDFIKIRELVDGNSHVVILSVDLSSSESQDLAAITVERLSDEEITLQIIGDKDVYGQQQIVEPTEEIMKGGKGGPSEYVQTISMPCNVYHWTCVRSMYGPGFRPYTSMWMHGRYPAWWYRWRCMPWAVYYDLCLPWRYQYRTVTMMRCANANQIWNANYIGCVSVHGRAEKIHSRRKAHGNNKLDNDHSKGNDKVKTKGDVAPGPTERGKGTKPTSGARKPTQSAQKKPAADKAPQAPKGKSAKPAARPASGAKKK
jgi:hypothetical protein